MLTLLLLDHFNEKESKIINVSSRAYKRSRLSYGESVFLNNYELMLDNYKQMRNKQTLYSNTKLLLNYFTLYLSTLFEKKYSYLKIVCLHPGVIYTNFFNSEKKMNKIILSILFKTILYFFTKDIVHGA